MPVSRTILIALGAVFVLGAWAAIAPLTIAFAQDEGGTNEAEEPEVDFKTLENPIAHTKDSIKRGRTIYLRYCTECHGPDGKAEIDLIADAMDLTSPILWRSGTAPGEIFRSIRDGAGVAMPPYKMQIRREEDMWHMVNFIQSLWPANKRPEIVEEPQEDAEADESSE